MAAGCSKKVDALPHDAITLLAKQGQRKHWRVNSNDKGKFDTQVTATSTAHLEAAASCL
jgi:hypothetical protein